MSAILVPALAVILVLVGVLIGFGLNGRGQIAREKRQARVQRELNDRERRLEASLRRLYQRHDEPRNPVRHLGPAG